MTSKDKVKELKDKMSDEEIKKFAEKQMGKYWTTDTKKT